MNKAIVAPLIALAFVAGALLRGLIPSEPVIKIPGQPVKTVKLGQALLGLGQDIASIQAQTAQTLGNAIIAEVKKSCAPEALGAPNSVPEAGNDQVSVPTP